MLSPELLLKLKSEVLTDPDKIYAGKTPAEIATLMASPIVTKADVLYAAPPPPPIVGTKIGETVTVKDPPVFRVIAGVPSAPNAFTAKDISDALAS